MSIITPSRPVRERATTKPLVAVLSDGHRRRHGVGSAVLRHLAGLGVDVTLIGCDAEDSALLQSWRNRDLVIVVDPVQVGPAPAGRVHRLETARPGSGRLVVLAVETGDEPDAAESAAEDVTGAIVAELAADLAAA